MNKLSASLEDYLEAILWTSAEKGTARSRDIAQYLKVKAVPKRESEKIFVIGK